MLEFTVQDAVENERETWIVGKGTQMMARGHNADGAMFNVIWVFKSEKLYACRMNENFASALHVIHAVTATSPNYADYLGKNREKEK